MPYAYTDEQGIPRTETGSVYIEIGGGGGGGVSTPDYDPTTDPAFVNMLTGGTMPAINFQLPSLPAQISGVGIGGMFASITAKTGLPAWVIIAMAAGVGFLALKKLGG